MASKGFDHRPLFFQLSWKQILSSWGIVALVFILFILYGFEIRRVENILNAGELLKQSLLLGALGAAAAAYHYAKTIDDYTDRFKAFTFIFGCILFFAPLFGSLVNRWGSFKSPQEKSYEVFEVEKVSAPEQNQTLKLKEMDYFIFIFENDNLERIRVKNLLEIPRKGDNINLNLHRGLLGWDWIEQ